MMSNLLRERRLEDIAEDELHLVGDPQFAGTIEGDGNHLLGKVDSRDLGPVRLGEVKRRTADAAADIRVRGRPGRSVPVSRRQRFSVVSCPPVLM